VLNRTIVTTRFVTVYMFLFPSLDWWAGQCNTAAEFTSPALYRWLWFIYLYQGTSFVPDPTSLLYRKSRRFIYENLLESASCLGNNKQHHWLEGAQRERKGKEKRKREKGFGQNKKERKGWMYARVPWRRSLRGDRTQATVRARQGRHSPA
jgi:hypothetical protein